MEVIQGAGVYFRSSDVSSLVSVERVRHLAGALIFTIIHY